MNAAVVSAFDAPPRYNTFAEPAAAEGETIVSVTAAGIANPAGVSTVTRRPVLPSPRPAKARTRLTSEFPPAP